ncbi:MAG: hypothetical protein U9N07_07775 [Euryarchaeota archaeon]|nr:hypothetical protein [Euryarchaeota archaeon]
MSQITDHTLPPAGHEAAGTKWNFHRYSPGLVGGHCIPVDPYYLVHRARGARVSSAGDPRFFHKKSSKNCPPGGVAVFECEDGWCDCGGGA